MKRIIYRHVLENRPGETEIYREVMVDGTNIIEREKVFDPMKSTAEKKRYKVLERRVDPSFAGYDLIQLVERLGLSNSVGSHQSVYEIGNLEGEKLEINLDEMREVFVYHPRHHWSPAMTSVIAGLAGRTNWNTPATEAA